jgi:hypothetical protein
LFLLVSGSLGVGFLSLGKVAVNKAKYAEASLRKGVMHLKNQKPQTTNQKQKEEASQ